MPAFWRWDWHNSQTHLLVHLCCYNIPFCSDTISSFSKAMRPCLGTVALHCRNHPQITWHMRKKSKWMYSFGESSICFIHIQRWLFSGSTKSKAWPWNSQRAIWANFELVYMWLFLTHIKTYKLIHPSRRLSSKGNICIWTSSNVIKGHQEINILTIFYWNLFIWIKPYYLDQYIIKFIGINHIGILNYICWWCDMWRCVCGLCVLLSDSRSNFHFLSFYPGSMGSITLYFLVSWK